jgi:tetratricopeptide (TPR) repeat protein
MRVLAAALVVTFATVRPAMADSPPEPAAVEQGRQLAAKAARQYQDGRFLEALESYQRAYDVAPVPELLFNIGQCHFQLKSYEWAIFFYQGYLADRPQAANRALVQSLIVESRRHMREQRPAARPILTRVAVAESAAPERDEPAFYQRWWFWTALGAAAVAAGGTAYYLHGSASTALPDRSLGTVDAR